MIKTEQQLQSIIFPEQEVPLCDKIIEIVSDCCMLKVDAILAPERGDQLTCDARHIAIHLIKKYCDKPTLKTIGAMFGGRHHSTIINSQLTFHNLFESDKEFRRKYECSNNLVKNLIEDQE